MPKISFRTRVNTAFTWEQTYCERKVSAHPLPLTDETLASDYVAMSNANELLMAFCIWTSHSCAALLFALGWPPRSGAP
jgi:hypothetical protein